MGVQLPHLFRKAKSPQEWIGPSTERVPLDADLHHMNITRKQYMFKRDLIKYYGTNKKVPGQGRQLWSVITGGFVGEDMVSPTQIFPTALGALIEQEIMDSGWLWQAENGLLLPKPIGLALHEWALAIVPDRSGAQLGPAGNGLRRLTKEYKFKVLDPESRNLRVPMYKRAGLSPEVAAMEGRQLDGWPLTFDTGARPIPALIYFQCCCAMWKKTCLQYPEVNECDEFFELFLGAMIELWGEFPVLETHKTISQVFKPRDDKHSAPRKPYWSFIARK